MPATTIDCVSVHQFDVGLCWLLEGMVDSRRNTNAMFNVDVGTDTINVVVCFVAVTVASSLV